jgi:hypothetical protein
VQKLQQSLLEPPRRPPDDRPLFTYFVATEKLGVITFALPTGERCLPMFTSPIDAGEYRRVLLSGGPPNQYMVSNASQVLVMLRDVERAGVTQLAVDRCPRCKVVASFQTAQMRSEDDIIKVWSIHVATKMSRAQLYLTYAVNQARVDRLAVARDVALAAAGHVTLDEPMIHLLIGEVAVALKDKALLSEAKAFLRYLHQDALLERLAQAERGGPTDLQPPEPPR